MTPDKDEQLSGCRSRIEMLNTENEILGRANDALRERVGKLESLLRRAYSHVVTVFDVALGYEIQTAFSEVSQPPKSEKEGQGGGRELCGACRKFGKLDCLVDDNDVMPYDESCDAFEDRGAAGGEQVQE